jgi:hypothetical protein
MLFSFLAAFCLTGSAFAQFSIGARVAGNLSTLSESGYDDDEEPEFEGRRRGIALGLVTEMRFSKMFAIQAEMLYSQYGAKSSGEESFEFGNMTYDITWEDKIRLNYFQIPVLAKVTLGSERLGFDIMAGPHLAYGVGKITYDYSYTERVNGVIEDRESGSESETWDELEANRFDFGFTGGIGISLPVGPGRLGLDARYQLGLLNLLEDPYENEKLTNRNIQIGLSYLMPIGR